MEDKEIIELLIQELIEVGEWFTTKKDPTFEEAPSYYELDQYGDPTENTKKKIVNEIKNYIGDGAVDIQDAIELWINEATMQYKVSYIDNLVTQFEPKPLIDQIEAYPVNLQESFNKDEVETLKADTTKIVSTHLAKSGPISFEINPEVSLAVKDTIIILKYKLLDKDIDINTLFNIIDDLKIDLIEQLTRATYRIDRIDVLIDRDDENLNIVVQIFEGKPSIETTADIKVEANGYIDGGVLTKMPDTLNQSSKYPKWNDEMWKQCYNDFVESRMAIYNGDSRTKMISLKQDAEKYNLPELQFTPESYKDDIEKLAIEYANSKKARYNNNYNKLPSSLKTESVKTKMEEENTKSLNLISSMFTAEDFDADSPQGQIVIKTSQLFNELSDKGYNVQVNFDNGESQSDILLGDIGGKVTITINGTNEPIKAFTQGSFELTDDIINTLNEIKDLVDNI